MDNLVAATVAISLSDSDNIKISKESQLADLILYLYRQGDHKVLNHRDKSSKSNYLPIRFAKVLPRTLVVYAPKPLSGGILNPRMVWHNLLISLSGLS
ncbi:hypothetical protein L2E82_30636 [Cichorium intybus]|uniref:Uncharacterized protein n=1 Tax=Cichorium intybus TaxID=13427 RepID=A0ACB9D0U2_CICIN|nr:hypothetical protein L2E82_30636 [Cichorium intybus]